MAGFEVSTNGRFCPVHRGGRAVGIVVGTVLVLATATRPSGHENGQGKEPGPAVRDALVEFGASQPQVPRQSTWSSPAKSRISRGGTVVFRVNGGGHGFAIYPVSKNTTRDDITPSCASTTRRPAPAWIRRCQWEPRDRRRQGRCRHRHRHEPSIRPGRRCHEPAAWDATIVVDSNGTPVAGAFHPGTTDAEADGTQIQYRFARTGRFLVICMNRAHYLNDWMFGFVNVVDGDEQ
jgi:hypothetical protein